MGRITAEKIFILEKMTRDQRVFACERDFLLFFAYYFTQYVKYPFSGFHEDMANDVLDLVDGKIRELAWIMFRESSKTSFAKALVVWLIAYKKRKYINVDAFERDNSERFLFDDVVTLQTNRRLRADFGELFNSPKIPGEKQAKRVSDFVTSNGIRVEAHTTQESIRGRLHVEQRPDFNVLDDYETMNTIRSQVATKQIAEHFSEMKGGIDQLTGRILYLSNYLSETANVAALCERALVDKDIRVRKVAILDENGEPSWPERHVLTDIELEDPKNVGKTSIETLKRSMWTVEGGDNDFEREMMLNPVNPDTLKFSRSQFKRYRPEDLLAKRTANYLLIDPPGAATPKESNDYCGWAVVKSDEDGFWFVEAWQSKPTPKEMCDSIFAIASRESIVCLGIESTQYWQGVKVFFEDEMRRRGHFITVKELKHSIKSKEDRILSLLPRYESGSIFHLEGKCGILEEQLARFPINKHDDVADALANAVEVVKPPGKSIGNVSQSKSNYVRPRK